MSDESTVVQSVIPAAVEPVQRGLLAGVNAVTYPEMPVVGSIDQACPTADVEAFGFKGK